jgi:ATP-dependent DNA helicase RecQ
LEDAHPDLSYVTTGLLRMYNTIFYFPTHIRESAICRQLKIKTEELVSILCKLDDMGILKYNKPGEGPQMFFHHYRVDSRHLLIDLNRINILKKRHEVRTTAMIAFLENKEICRERILLTYFGERPQHDCGHCDVCRDKRKEHVDIKNLRAELQQQIKQKGQITIRELVAPYSTAIKEEAIALLRNMLDEGILHLHENGTISL